MTTVKKKKKFKNGIFKQFSAASLLDEKKLFAVIKHVVLAHTHTHTRIYIYIYIYIYICVCVCMCVCVCVCVCVRVWMCAC